MIGKWILIFGVLVTIVGAVVWLAERLGLPLGRLPQAFLLPLQRYTTWIGKRNSAQR
jgi:hypothetical protein